VRSIFSVKSIGKILQSQRIITKWATNDWILTLRQRKTGARSHFYFYFYAKRRKR
jgi:hypothetical protein